MNKAFRENKNVPNFDWCYYTRKMLENLADEYHLPEGSLLMLDNKSKKNPLQTISYTIYIYEPDYPEQEYKPEQNKIVLIVSLSTAKRRPDDLDLNIKAIQAKEIEDKIPVDAAVLKQTKLDIKTKSKRIRFNKNSDNIVDFIRQNAIYCIENYKSKADNFGCCSKFEKCSRCGKCIHENLLYSKACAYRKNLEAGKIFY